MELWRIRRGLLADCTHAGKAARRALDEVGALYRHLEHAEFSRGEDRAAMNLEIKRRRLVIDRALRVVAASLDMMERGGSAVVADDDIA